MKSRTAAPLLAALLLGVTACSSGHSTATEDPGPSTDSAGHGEIEGAEEVAEAQLGVLSIDAQGAVTLLDLLDDSSTDLGQVPPPTATHTDGRYLFATTADGIEIVDSGVWTWDHGDHFHYYRSEPGLVGTVPGSGPATIATGPLSTAGGTGVFFPSSGEAVLLDNAALADGEPDELFRLDLRPHAGLIAPLGDGAVVSVPDDSDSVPDGSAAVTAVRRYDADGTPIAGSTERCAAAAGSITTSVGLVVGCADGALLWTEGNDGWEAERVPYPDGAQAPPATEFSAREGRPTVAALAGRRGIWLLDTRERTWELLDTGAPLHQVVAADDEEGHVVALDRSGRVRVYLAGSGRQVAVSRPLLSGAPGKPIPAGVTLVVDDQRAYLNDPAGERVLEIDYADGARVARTLTPAATPDFFAEVGR